MTTSPEPTAIRFDDYSFWVDLDDGRTLGIPLAWFPRLLHATPAQREAAQFSHSGLHWEEIDEDISIAGLLAGRGDRTMSPRSHVLLKGLRTCAPEKRRSMLRLS